jgi:hypothetical protein
VPERVPKKLTLAPELIMRLSEILGVLDPDSGQ